MTYCPCDLGIAVSTEQYLPEVPRSLFHASAQSQNKNRKVKKQFDNIGAWCIVYVSKQNALSVKTKVQNYG